MQNVNDADVACPPYRSGGRCIFVWYIIAHHLQPMYYFRVYFILQHTKKYSWPLH